MSGKVAALKQQLSITEKSSDKIRVLVELGKEYAVSNPEVGLTYLKRAIQLLANYYDKELLADALYNQGRNYSTLGNYEDAIESFEEAKELFETIGNIKGISEVWSNVGVVHLKNSNEKEAVECFMKSLEQNTLIRNYEGIAKNYNNIGSVYFRLGDIDNALRYYDKAYDTAKEHFPNKPIQSAIYYNNYAAIYTEKKEYDKALGYLEEALSLSEASGNWKSIAIYHSNIGEIYLKLGNHINALSHLTKALSIKRKRNLTYGLPSTLLNLAKISWQKNKLDKALRFAEDGLNIALKNNDTLQVKAGYKVLVTIYKKLHNFEKALNYQEELQRITEKIHQQEKDQELLKLKKQLELSQRDHEIELQQLQLEKQAIELEEKHRIEAINVRLEEIVEQRTYKLKLKNKQLEAFAHVVDHDIKNTIRNIGSFSGLILKRYNEDLPFEAKEFLDFVSLNANYLYRQFEDLILYASLEDVSYPDEPVNVSEVIKDVMSSLLNNIIEGRVVFQIGKMPKLYMDYYHLLQIFQNLIENAIEYRDTERKAIIKIQAKSYEEGYLFVITDNGIGIDMQYHQQIFQLFKRLGRQEYDGTGTGLAITKKILELYHGNIWLESIPNEGSTFSFYIPNQPNKYK